MTPSLPVKHSADVPQNVFVMTFHNPDATIAGMKVTPMTKLFFQNTDALIEKFLTFILSAVIAFDSSVLVRLPGHNPYHISNLYNDRNFNPETNYIRIVYIVVATIALFYGLSWIARRSRVVFRILVAAFVGLTFLIGSAIPGQSYSQGSIDTFHHGEQLSPALAYYHGKHLFEDIFFLHGAGEDVLLPSLSMYIAGHPSIATHFVIETSLKALAGALFIVMLARILAPGGLFLFAALWFASSTYTGMFYVKNIIVYIIIMLLWYALLRPLARRLQLVLLGTIGLLSSVSFLYSIDVGLFLGATMALLLAALTILHTSAADRLAYKLKQPHLHQLDKPGALLGGFAAGQLLLLAGLGVKNYAGFFTMTFIEIPRYQGLMFDFPVQPLTVSSVLFWIPVLIAGLTGFMLFHVAVRQYRRTSALSAHLLFATLLYALGMLYLRGGVGRPDVPHIEAAVPVLMASAFLTVIVYFQDLWRRPLSEISAHWPIIALFILLIFPKQTFEPVNLFAAGGTTIGQVNYYIHPERIADRTFYPKEFEKVTEYIKGYTKSSDGIYVFTPQPLYYYSTGRTNPSRFFITWFADPQPFTNELLADLKASPPKLIVYKSNSPYEEADGTPTADRVPEVDRWIHDNYLNETTIGSTILLTK